MVRPVVNTGEMIESVAKSRGFLSRAEDELMRDTPDWMKVARELGRVTDTLPLVASEIVVRALRAGASQREVEDALGLARGALRGWKKEALRDSA